jgi:hypothetical protein
MVTKTVAGPIFRVDNSLPCGCRISRDEDTKKLRLWYCTTHAAAFEVLEALRENAHALDSVIKHAPHLPQIGHARHAEDRARMAIRRATAGV